MITRLPLTPPATMPDPRDLSATPASADYDVNARDGSAQYAIRTAEQEPDNPHQYQLIDVPSHLARGLLERYARGDPLPALQQYFQDGYLPTLRHAARLSATFFPQHRLRLHFEQPASWMLLFALVCFDEDGTHMTHLDDWFTPDCDTVLYAMVLKGLVPDYAYAAQYDRDSTAIPHEAELVSALLQPRVTWPHAFAAYMKQWPKLMRRYGYREHAAEDKHPFGYFPLHLGLAVCAFDIDDSAFRHLPYYPHELVDYYRTHRRHTRDAWRTGDIEPATGLPDDARPQPKKTYALSKAEAWARWVELICGEQAALTGVARKALGKRKTMPPLEMVMEALAMAGLAIRADLKDDDSVAGQATDLFHAWNLPAPVLPEAPPHGPALVTAILNTLRALDAAHGQAMAVLDDGGGDWNVVLYSSHHAAEFSTLCEQLGIRRHTPEQWQ